MFGLQFIHRSPNKQHTWSIYVSFISRKYPMWFSVLQITLSADNTFKINCPLADNVRLPPPHWPSKGTILGKICIFFTFLVISSSLTTCYVVRKISFGPFSTNHGQNQWDDRSEWHISDHRSIKSVYSQFPVI